MKIISVCLLDNWFAELCFSFTHLLNFLSRFEKINEKVTKKLSHVLIVIEVWDKVLRAGSQ